jgi:hypothetical protein
MLVVGQEAGASPAMEAYGSQTLKDQIKSARFASTLQSAARDLFRDVGVDKLLSSTRAL